MNPEDDAHLSDQSYKITPVDEYDSGSSYRDSSESLDESNRRGRRKLHESSRRANTNTPVGKGDSNEATPTSNDPRKEPAERWSESRELATQDSNNVNSERNISATPRKRRASSSKYGEETIRRSRYLRSRNLRSTYNDGYRQLLNNDIKDATSNSLPSDYPPLPTTQIGSSTWTHVEKDAFFLAIGRLGKDNIPGIATRIGSKTKLQVQEYIDVLQNSHSLRKPLPMTDFPAAFEVSDECCQVLEQAGDALSIRQEHYEEALERAKWGDDSWLLTEDVNEWVESHLSEEGGEQTVAEVLPAAQLLNLGNWLEISTRVFMNPAEREDENWRCLIQDGEEHGIRATAFSDFQNLTISLTKRLISATIFCTMSRLRAKDMDVKHRQEVVTSADVKAAAQIMGLRGNSHEFWKYCPRRNNLQVFQRLVINPKGRSAMDFDEVETRLNVTTPNRRSRSRSNLGSNPRSRASSVSTINATDVDLPSEEEYQTEANAFSQASNIDDPDIGADSNPTVQPYAPANLSGHPSPQPVVLRPSLTQTTTSCVDIQSPESQHLAYAENLDVLASVAEEGRLWTLLGKNPSVLIKEDVEPPAIPKLRPRAKEDTMDWREKVEYWSPWEIHDTLPREDIFAENRRISNKRRKLVRDNVEDLDSEVGAGTGLEQECDEDEETGERSDSDAPYPKEMAMEVDRNLISGGRSLEIESEEENAEFKIEEDAEYDTEDDGDGVDQGNDTDAEESLRHVANNLSEEQYGEYRTSPGWNALSEENGLPEREDEQYLSLEEDNRSGGQE